MLPVVLYPHGVAYLAHVDLDCPAFDRVVPPFPPRVRRFRAFRVGLLALRSVAWPAYRDALAHELAHRCERSAPALPSRAHAVPLPLPVTLISSASAALMIARNTLRRRLYGSSARMSLIFARLFASRHRSQAPGSTAPSWRLRKPRRRSAARLRQAHGRRFSLCRGSSRARSLSVGVHGPSMSYRRPSIFVYT